MLCTRTDLARHTLVCIRPSTTNKVAPDGDGQTAGVKRPTKGCGREVVLTAVVMLLNFLSAVGIVMVNKVLFRWGKGVRFATLLTAFHFLATAAGLRACRALGMYERKPLRQRQVKMRLLLKIKFIEKNHVVA